MVRATDLCAADSASGFPADVCLNGLLSLVNQLGELAAVPSSQRNGVSVVCDRCRRRIWVHEVPSKALQAKPEGDRNFETP